jgi:hypothetical protein
MENLKLFNQEMIEKALLREATVKEKCCFKLAGEELSNREKLCYRIICENGISPISAEDIGIKIYGQLRISCREITEANTKNVWTIITRLRQKLGHSEIVGREGFGYVSRRMMINEMVNRNKEKNKV